MVIHDINQDKQETIVLIHPMNFSGHGKAKEIPISAQLRKQPRLPVI
ncbi:hypothetical protein QP141_07515 [Alloscardovia omnicolens]|jgi:hypothetical protein|nr:hypothetical protein [Alloscardovia omnicolens]MDK6250271.1 hypothetical protein [Alloscardovia omnicolens]MDK6445684.1 hypothetical protein [Alloscardovia omnicolens]MDK6664202.1 hypothetical protein [Alloscardovia omnicolens]MDK7748560.1 hypothetical protein [Alloscardovia omnicolens]MDK8074132.1 hypothetical protein [Alloscardovia omnicolens]